MDVCDGEGGEEDHASETMDVARCALEAAVDATPQSGLFSFGWTGKGCSLRLPLRKMARAVHLRCNHSHCDGDAVVEVDCDAVEAFLEI